MTDLNQSSIALVARSFVDLFEEQITPRQVTVLDPRPLYHKLPSVIPSLSGRLGTYPMCAMVDALQPLLYMTGVSRYTLVEHTVCSGTTHSTREDMSILYLCKFPPGTTNTSIGTLLELFRSIERIDGKQYPLRTYGSSSSSVTTTDYYRQSIPVFTSKVVALYIQRLATGSMKCATEVDICSDGGMLTMGHRILIGAIVHRGSSIGGHYIAYARNIDGKWYKFTDANVFPVEHEGKGAFYHDPAFRRDVVILIYDDLRAVNSINTTSSTYGIRNIGNTCFMASVLQVLMRSPTFVAAMYKLKDVREILSSA